MIFVENFTVCKGTRQVLFCEFIVYFILYTLPILLVCYGHFSTLYVRANVNEEFQFFKRDTRSDTNITTLIHYSYAETILRYVTKLHLRNLYV